jgi:hypothetical protein
MAPGYSSYPQLSLPQFIPQGKAVAGGSGVFFDLAAVTNSRQCWHEHGFLWSIPV